MKNATRIIVLGLIAGIGLLFSAAPAAARVDWSINIGVPAYYPPPVYYAPPPVAYAPAPVYVRPVPRVVYVAPRYYPPYDYGRNYWRGRGWREYEWRERGWHR